MTPGPPARHAPRQSCGELPASPDVRRGLHQTETDRVTDQRRRIDVVERPEVPWLSVVLGYGPMLPFAAGALAAWRLADLWRGEAILLTVVWGAAILAFLAGVRRGLSFRTEGGPMASQIVTMFGLFVVALMSLVAIVHGSAVVAVTLLLVGFLALMILDPIAARRGEAPLFFARLRPPQMAVAMVSLAALLLNVILARG